MQITEKLREAEIAGFTAGFSLEVFLPDQQDGITALRQRVERFASSEPMFLDVAACGSRATIEAAIKLASYAKRFSGLATMTHVACADLTKEETRELLHQAKAAGLRNLLVERGVPLAVLREQAAAAAAAAAAADSAPTPLEAVAVSLRPPFRATPGGFVHTADLVRFIRQEFGEYFCIIVVGYPSGVGEYGSFDADLSALVAKQEAGADVVLAQHVNDAPSFRAFRDAAVKAGVVLPILPSVMLVQDYDSYQAANAYCGVPVPPTTAAAYATLRHDSHALRSYALRHTAALCKDLLASGATCIHFITFNLESTLKGVLSELGLSGPGAAARRKLPWRPSGDEARQEEDVRPIFWANRPASYVERTSSWDKFPSGRWSSGVKDRVVREYMAPVGELLVPHTAGSAEERRAMWGEVLEGEADVWQVFARFMRGAVPRLPWSEGSLLPETGTISSQLIALNEAGFLTINSQPRVNAAASDDPVFGWGGSGGLVYQKAYVECFCSPRHLAALIAAVADRPSVTYRAVDARGNLLHNCRTRGVTAVTWGVFPDREIMQPTVVDPDAFLAWKAEAFALWLSQWAASYDDDSTAADVIHDIHDSYYLIHLVDNDFIAGDVFAVFADALSRLSGGGGEAASGLAAPAQN